MSDLFTPSSLDELLSLLATDDHGTMVAGGTDWTIMSRRPGRHPRAVIDLSGVGELHGLTSNDGDIRVGATTTMAELSSSSLVAFELTALAEAAGAVGSEQIRHSATLGGNLANASPAADTPVAVAALDGQLELTSRRGVRSVSVADFLAARSTTILECDEVLTAVVFPRTDRVSAFAKVGSRSQVSIARLNLAIALLKTGLPDARVFVGTLGLAARRCEAAEAALAAADEPALTAALRAFVDQTIPGRSTAPYKKSAMGALVEDLWADLNERRDRS